MMKTSEEIKKGLERCKNGARCDDCLGAYHCQVKADALSLIEQLETDNEMLMGMVKGHSKFSKWYEKWANEQIARAESKVPKWISVDDRLPNIDAEVLIYTDEGLYDVAQYSGGERFWTLERNPDCWVTASGVTHWMPLPEPPKEK